ncbi:MAG: Jag N-terminal domain-containing protein [Clostridia bacterium]|nr:Jag N-terminal domain-containing protein [Clostridia bacterium]
MARTVIKKGNTVEEAINLALAELELDLENADVEVLGNEDQYSVVKVTEHIADEAKISSFIKEVMAYLGVEGDLSFSYPDEETIKVDITGSNISSMIGKRGDVVYAISYLSNIIVNKDKTVFKRIVVDCENYRANKEKKLIDLANSTAARVCKYRRPIQLPPMPAAERRIIHTVLQSNRMVETESFGVEPQRCVVIRLRPYTKVI